MDRLLVIGWLLFPINLTLWVIEKIKSYIAGGYSG